MKMILPIILLAAVSCNNADKKAMTNITGVYTMLSLSVKGNKTDTTYTTRKQLKIFTGDYMMYANVEPADSVSGFGIGRYTIDSGTVTENIIYNAYDTSANATPRSFKLIIEKTSGGYQQVIPEVESQGEKLRMTEAYNTAGTAVTSPLDGCWKGIKILTIKGADTILNQLTQYKTYFEGYFIFGHTYTDSAMRTHTGIGYGTFEMNGTDKLKENVIASTYSEARGKSFNIDIEMNGADEFKQTIVQANGDKDVEIYQRLKK